MHRSASARSCLLLLACLAAGCYFGPPPPYGPPPGYGYPGNISLTWTFSGGSCAQTPGVVKVMVSIPSDPTPILPNVFLCQVGNPPSQLVIQGYNPGSYLVNLSGLDGSGNVIWLGSATVVVNGNVFASIDLKPVGSNNTAFLSWSFAPAVGTFFPACTSAADTDPDRIDSVALYVDNSATPSQTYDCDQGSGTGQVSTPSLAPGSHTLQLVAYQAGIAYPFAQSDAVTVNLVANTPSSQSFTFAWLVGGVGVAWSYPSSSACAGPVSSVSANFSGGSGYGVSGVSCETAVAPFKRLPAMSTAGAPGLSYALTVSALGAAPQSPVVYSGSVAAVTIQPGTFYDGTTATLVSVPLN